MKTFEVFINSELRELKEWCNIKNNSTKLNLGQNQAFVRSPKMSVFESVNVRLKDIRELFRLIEQNILGAIRWWIHCLRKS